jgi:branched-chain amino acid aminotransferase
MIVDLDGVLLDATQARVSAFDAGYLYGDGLFETLRAYRGHLHRFERHLDRIAREAELLRLDVNTSTEHWRTRIGALLEANDLFDTDARVRIQISRGGTHETDPSRAEPGSTQPVEFVTAREIPESVALEQENGVRVMTLQSAFARGNFPQINSLNYLPSIMALRFARASGYDEALVLNAQKRILEAATANVFAVYGGVLRTPSPRLGLLPGITRQAVLDIAPRIGLRTDEVMGELKDVLLADEVFLTGSVKEIVPVVAIDRTTIATGRPGKWTRLLQEAYREEVEYERAAAE